MNAEIIKHIERDINYLQGLPFEAVIRETPVKGHISVEDTSVFLCQNEQKGNECKNKLGYMFSFKLRIYDFIKALEGESVWAGGYVTNLQVTFNLELKPEGGDYIVCIYESETNIPINYCFKTLHGNINEKGIINNILGNASGFAPYNHTRFRNATKFESEIYEIIGNCYDVTNVSDEVLQIYYSKKNALLAQYSKLKEGECYYIEFTHQGSINKGIIKLICDINLLQNKLDITEHTTYTISGSLSKFSFSDDIESLFLRKANSFEIRWLEGKETSSYYNWLDNKNVKEFIDEENNEAPENPLPIGYVKIKDFSWISLSNIINKEVFYPFSKNIEWEILCNKINSLKIINYFKKNYVCQYQDIIFLLSPEHLTSYDENNIVIENIYKNRDKLQGKWITLPLLPKNHYLLVQKVLKDNGNKNVYIASVYCLVNGVLKFTEQVFDKNEFYNVKSLTIVSEVLISNILTNLEETTIDFIRNSSEEYFIFSLPENSPINISSKNNNRMFKKEELITLNSTGNKISELGVITNDKISEILSNKVNKKIKNLFTVNENEIYKFDDFYGDYFIFRSFTSNSIKIKPNLLSDYKFYICNKFPSKIKLNINKEEFNYNDYIFS